MRREMNYPGAIQGEERYVDYDPDFDMWSVFGVDSGHCYKQFFSEADAEESLN